MADGNGAVLAALTEGVSALVLRVGTDGVAAADLDRMLEGVFLELVPVILDVRDAGGDYVDAADAVLALVTDLDDERRARLSVDLGADPLTAPLTRPGRPRRSTTSSAPRPGPPGTTAACGPSPSTVPPSTISARVRRGNSRAPSPRA